jgi:UDP-glucuronate 4-epimerase
MAPGLFAKAIAEGAPLQLFNHGRMSRDFTYVDDVAEGTVRVLDSPAKPDPAWSGVAPLVASSSAPWRVYNIGNGRPTELLRFVELLEQAFGRNSERVLLPMQPGDVPATWADVRALEDQIGFRPTTTIEVGTARFVQWYREYYCV